MSFHNKKNIKKLFCKFLALGGLLSGINSSVSALPPRNQINSYANDNVKFNNKYDMDEYNSHNLKNNSDRNKQMANNRNFERNNRRNDRSDFAAQTPRSPWEYEYKNGDFSNGKLLERFSLYNGFQSSSNIDVSLFSTPNTCVNSTSEYNDDNVIKVKIGKKNENSNQIYLYASVKKKMNIEIPLSTLQIKNPTLYGYIELLSNCSNLDKSPQEIFLNLLLRTSEDLYVTKSKTRVNLDSNIWDRYMYNAILNFIHEHPFGDFENMSLSPRINRALPEDQYNLSDTDNYDDSIVQYPKKNVTDFAQNNDYIDEDNSYNNLQKQQVPSKQFDSFAPRKLSSSPNLNKRNNDFNIPDTDSEYGEYQNFSREPDRFTPRSNNRNLNMQNDRQEPYDDDQEQPYDNKDQDSNRRYFRPHRGNFNNINNDDDNQNYSNNQGQPNAFAPRSNNRNLNSQDDRQEPGNDDQEQPYGSKDQNSNRRYFRPRRGNFNNINNDDDNQNYSNDQGQPNTFVPRSNSRNLNKQNDRQEPDNDDQEQPYGNKDQNSNRRYFRPRRENFNNVNNDDDNQNYSNDQSQPNTFVPRSNSRNLNERDDPNEYDISENNDGNYSNNNRNQGNLPQKFSNRPSNQRNFQDNIQDEDDADQEIILNTKDFRQLKDYKSVRVNRPVRRSSRVTVRLDSDDN